MNYKKKLKNNTWKSDYKLVIHQVMVLVVIVAIFCFLYPIIRYDYKDSTQIVGMENIFNCNSYSIVGNTFKVTGTDPNITIENNLDYVNIVYVRLDGKAENDTDIAIYYAKENKQFSEQNVKYSIIKKGNSNIKLYLPKNKFKAIRLDIEKDFKLDYVELSGKKSIENNIKFICSICLFVLFTFLLEMKITKNYKKIDKHLLMIINKISKFLVWFDKGIEKKFVVIAMVMGGLFALLVPPEQVPDEPAQYSMIENEFGFSGYYNEIYQYYENIGATRVVRNYEIKQSKELIKKHSNDKFSKECKRTGNVSIKMVAHLPQGIVFFICTFLGAPIALCMHVAEFAAVVFFVLMGYLALKIMPIKKSLLCAVMLLPMNLQQCSSVSYDAVLLPVCFFWLSYLMNLIIEKKEVMIKDVFVVLGCLFIISIIKPPYVMLGLIAFCIPKDKYTFLKTNRIQMVMKYKKIIAVAFICLGCFALYLFKSNVYIKILLACLIEFYNYLKILCNTFIANKEFYICSTIGVLGWLDTKFSIGYYILTIVFLIILSQSNDKMQNKRIEKRQRIIFCGVAILLMLVIITIMLSWTFYILNYDSGVGYYIMSKYLNNISVVLGVQGRYFIPIAFLSLFSVSNFIKINNKVANFYQIMYYLCGYIYVIKVLLQRFWI